MKSFIQVIFLILLSVSAYSQNKMIQNRTITGTQSYWYKDTMAIQNARSNSMESFGEMERAVDPEKYIIGPGDSFILSILSYQPKEIKLPVTPEGNVIVPGIGTIDVNELTLKSAVNKINSRVEELYEGSQVYTVLFKIKKFKIRVSGKVGKSQIVTATSMDRVSEVIDRVGGLDFDASIRNISLLRNSKDTVLNVDLERFFYLNDERSNPYVQGGDHIIVSQIREDRIVLVSGEVYSDDINIEWAKDDSLANVIRLAKGFTPFAKLDSIELLRLDQSSNSYRKYYLDLSNWKNVLEKPFVKYENDIPILPGDRIYIRKKQNTDDEKYVSIRGEVKFPGRYTLIDKELKLKELIEMSGGLTEDASLTSAVLIRQKNIQGRDFELERLENKPLSEMSEQEKKYYDVRIKEKKGAMVIDFNELMKSENSKYNLVLQDKDSIYIPEIQNYINVQGRVVKPGLVKYQEGLNYMDYVRLAGGFTSKADDNETFIKRVTGEQFLASEKNYELQPGDMILVPQEPEADFWSEFFKWFTFVTQLITVVSVIITLSNQARNQ
jgi:protein involved in polysaccharide export with SLBB domain